MKKTISLLALILLVLSFTWNHTTEVFAQNDPTRYEHILNFGSDVVVNQDASLTVTETIRVYADNEKIIHGIYRDFPTSYKDSKGFKHKIAFTILSVKRDGGEEAYHTSSLSNGVRIYIGSSDTILLPNFYTYTLTYNVTRELGFFTDHDELYWNVTGNGWDFNMSAVSATVHLPNTVPTGAITTTAYTGKEGSKEQAFTSSTENTTSTFETTRALGSEEGLTIVVSWPKGYVHEPTSNEKLLYFFQDNVDAILAIIFSIILFIYYFLTWKKVGVDPKRKTIIAEYEPPQGLSPSFIRYNTEFGFDKKNYAAAVLSMAVKGYLTIEESGKHYDLVLTGKGEEKLSVEEKALADSLFKKRETVEVKQSNYVALQRAESALSDSLEKTFGKTYFILNRKFIGLGIALTILFMIGIIATNPGTLPLTGFMAIWLSFWTAGTGAMIYSATKIIRTKFVTGFFLLLFSLFFVAGIVVAIWVLATTGAVAFALFVIIAATINLIFFFLLKKRTPVGQDLQEKIDGFKLFLSVTEKDRLNFFNPPERTPELFEKYLPYALALDVEQKWAEQFTEVLKKAGEDYTPAWYHGSHFMTATSSGAFAGGFSNSFTGAISSSSTAPGSSSGSGGGGSSGGGGGGW